MLFTLLLNPVRKKVNNIRQADKSSTKDTIAVMLQSIADSCNYPLRLNNQDDFYESRKRIKAFGIQECDEFNQVITISDEKVRICGCITLKKHLFPTVLDYICENLVSEFHASFSYDVNRGTLVTHVEIPLADFEFVPSRELEQYMLLEFLYPIQLVRIFYHIYTSGPNFALPIEVAIAAAKKVVLDHVLDIDFEDDIVRRTVERHGVRYYVEQVALREGFYKDPYGTSSAIRRDAHYTLGSLLGEYGLPAVPDYSKIKIKHLNGNSDMSCTHLIIPNTISPGDCSDILLLIKDNKAYYYTIEVADNSQCRTKPGCHLCGISPKGTRMNFGYSADRKKALIKFKKILKENRLWKTI